MSEEEKKAIEFLKADNEKAYNKKSLIVETTYNVVDIVLNYIDKLQKENEKLKDKLHEKNMQIIKLNELLGELIEGSDIE